MAFDYKGAGAGGALGGGAGYGVGSFIGDLFAGGNRDEIARLLAELQAEAGPSAFGSIQEDPALRKYQTDSLAALKEIADAKGMDTSARVGLDQALGEVNRNAAGQTGAIQQAFESRGMGGGGGELAARLSAAQGNANRTAQFGAQAASDASRRALQAISQYGADAGKVRGQDWNIASGKANAQDVMSRFNAGQRVDKTKMAIGWEDEEAQRKRDLGGGLGGALGGAAGFLTGGLF